MATFKYVKVFVDTDVFISSLMSQTGAANWIINQYDHVLKLYISNYSKSEIARVINRHGLNPKKSDQVISGRFELIELSQDSSEIEKEFESYVTDQDDAYIIAGANKSKARFLITYNLRHYKIENIKQDLDIITLNPGAFLQYLRSLEN